MTNKKIWMGILAMVLVFGMTVVGCDNGSTSNNNEINVLDTFNFSTEEPNPAILSSAGNLTPTQFNTIKSAAGGGFYGWAIDNDGDLVMAWTDRDILNHGAVKDALQTIRGVYSSYDDGPLNCTDGPGYSMNYSYYRSSFSGFYVSAGTLILYIMKI